MTLSFPEWLLTIENLTAGWKYDTYQGEPANPALAAHLLDDGFRFSWGFRDNLAPGVLDPETLNFKFTCAAPSDMPSIRQGDQLVLRLQRPPGAVSRVAGVLTGAGVSGAIDIVWQGFRVRTTDAQYHRPTKRTILAIAATSYMADLNPEVDMTYGGANFLKYDTESVGLSVYGRPMAVSAPLVRDFTTVAAYLRVWGRALGEVDIRYGGDTTGGVRKLQLLDSIEKWTQGQRHDIYNGLNYDLEMGWTGVDAAVMLVAMVVGEQAMYPFPLHSSDQVLRGPLGNARSGLFYMAAWGAYTELDTAPYELAMVAGKLSSVRVAGVGLEDNSDLLIIDADKVESSPKWKSTRENSVNIWRWLGLSVDTGVDNHVEEFTITDEAAVIRNGPVSRTIETLLVANVYAGSGAEGLNGTAPDLPDPTNLRALELNYRDTIPPASADWSPEAITILPRALTDEEWDGYADRWHPTGKLQQAIALVNIDDDENLAGPNTPIFQTMTGCDIRLSKGHLLIEPSARPMRMRFLGAAAATVGDVKTGFPTVKLSDIASDFTVGQARLTGP